MYRAGRDLHVRIDGIREGVLGVAHRVDDGYGRRLDRLLEDLGGLLDLPGKLVDLHRLRRRWGWRRLGLSLLHPRLPGPSARLGLRVYGHGCRRPSLYVPCLRNCPNT